jgi:adenosine/AMP kinase
VNLSTAQSNIRFAIKNHHKHAEFTNMPCLNRPKNGDSASAATAKPKTKTEETNSRDYRMLKLKTVKITPPTDTNLILGMAHFIKTVEDIYEALVNAVPNIKFGLGFCESSGPCLVRHEGNDPELRRLASEKAYEIACGHSFIIYMRNAYPINVLDKVKKTPEVCTVYAATANPLEVVIAETEQGRGIIGVVDGSKSKGIETDAEIKERREFLRKIGYKLG